MTSYKVMYDQEFAPANPPDTAAVVIYAGGAVDHVWTPEEIAAQGSRARFPMWGYGLGANGVVDARRFGDWLDKHGVPPECAVGVDMETRIDAAYLADFYEHFTRWTLGLYGSKDSLFGNPEADFWFPADWTGHPHLFAHPNTLATQYAAASLGQSGGTWDLSLVAPALTLWSHQHDPIQIYETSGQLSLAAIAGLFKTAPSTILRVTLERQSSGRFPADLAAYINQGDLKLPMPAGIHLDIAPGRAWSG